MRDYSSISPSAKSLLLMKGRTSIPFMLDASKLIWGDETEHVLADLTQDGLYIRRLLHFEIRYLTINTLIEALGRRNILEISSGFSFRGLQMAIECPDVFYIDTDLPEIIATKVDLTDQLIAQQNLHLKGQLHTVPMNALDRDDFIRTTNQFPDGPIQIVNEGLLVYLDAAEKTKLCETIRKILKDRSGEWITADIYIKKKIDQHVKKDAFNQFLESHRVEENKFDSFQQAEQFFKERGFKLKRKAGPVWHQVCGLKYLVKPEIAMLILAAKQIGKLRETWALAPY